ncbi:MAG: transporter substrate-binding domain-containing protein [Rhodoferax sp.]|nr:transporter substrate-binding domain-containing protein [Rhodoferax sp.]
MRSLFAALILCMTSTPGSVAQTLTLKGGVPEGLPGYAMGMDGSLTIEVPLKKRIFQCIEKALDARVVWEAYPTRRVVQMLIDGKLDLAFPMGFTSERASKMLQSRPTWENPDNWLSMRPLDITDKSLRIAARLGSPQQVDYLADGYTHVVGTYTYEELVRTLVQGLADAVIVPQSVYEDMKADWPKETRVSVGRARNSGFYLNATDPKGLLAPLNRAIDRCRVAAK